jgi:tRNA (guanine37-N1)-methyltransferase
MLSGFFEESIISRAVEKKLVEIELINLRDFAIDKYGSVDDRPYGGGVGMIMRVDVIYKALEHVISSEARNPAKRSLRSLRSLDSSVSARWRILRNDGRGRKIVLTSPKGKLFTQKKAVEYSKLNHLIIIAGHYEGVDARVLDFVDEEISLGDFILTGGEIVAAAITDAVVRLTPGVLKKREATQIESFSNKLLEYPQYTRPEVFMGRKVPKILLSGNHKEIEKWRRNKAYEETLKKRKDLLDKN